MKVGRLKQLLENADEELPVTLTAPDGSKIFISEMWTTDEAVNLSTTTDESEDCGQDGCHGEASRQCEKCGKLLCERCARINHCDLCYQFHCSDCVYQCESKAEAAAA